MPMEERAPIELKSEEHFNPKTWRGVFEKFKDIDRKQFEGRDVRIAFHSSLKEALYKVILDVQSKVSHKVYADKSGGESEKRYLDESLGIRANFLRENAKLNKKLRQGAIPRENFMNFIISDIGREDWSDHFVDKYLLEHVRLIDKTNNDTIRNIFSSAIGKLLDPLFDNYNKYIAIFNGNSQK
jgi:hypothetical protein